MQLYSTPGSSFINNNLILNESRGIKDYKLQKDKLENFGFFYLVPSPPRRQSCEHTGVFIKGAILLYENYKLAIPVTLFVLQM